MIKNTIKRTIALTSAAAIILTAACGCSSDKGASAVSASDESNSENYEEVTMILDWTPNTNHTGIYVADQLGYYEEAGIKVNIEMPANGVSSQLVGAGKGEFGISNQENVTYARSLDDPMPIKSIAAIISHNTSGFVSLSSSNIDSPADWGQKTYGGYGGTTEIAIVKKIASDYGVDPDTINFVELGDADAITSLQNGIDFMWVYEGAELITFEENGIDYNYLPLRDFGDEYDYYTPVIIANTDYTDANSDIAAAFVKATQKGYEYAIENPDDAAQILLSAVSDLDENTTIKSQLYLSQKYAEDATMWGWQEDDVWQRYATFLEDNGLLGGQISIDGAYTNEYLTK